MHKPLITDTKQQVIKLIETLPDNVSVDQIMEQLYFKIQIDAGLDELDRGMGVPHEEVEHKFLQNKA